MLGFYQIAIYHKNSWNHKKRYSLFIIFLSELSVCSLYHLQSFFLSLGSRYFIESPVLDVFSPIRIRSQRITFILQSQRQHLIEVEDLFVVELDVLVPDTFKCAQLFDFLFVSGFSLFGFWESLEEFSSDFINFTFKIITSSLLFWEETFFSSIKIDLNENSLFLTPIIGYINLKYYIFQSNWIFYLHRIDQKFLIQET